MRKIKWILFILLFLTLVYTRFFNLSWGLPYPFHPDERNMSVSIMELSRSSLNPRFFAYGQFPLYLGYFLIQVYHLLIGKAQQIIAFEEATITLRFISALSSIVNVFILLIIVKIFIKENPKSKILNPKPAFAKATAGRQIQNPTSQIHNLLLTTSYFLLFTFSPALIQFSHFGTTESLLMLFYSLIIYLSLRSLDDRTKVVNIFLLALLCGLAIATKLSSVLFLVLPLVTVLIKRNKFSNKFIIGIRYIILTIIIAIFFSPYNIISFTDFLGAMRYESTVATLQNYVFYTRQFLGTLPIVFAFLKIFPYTLGWPIFIFFILGFIFLPKKREFNLLRLAFLIYFLPNAFLFTKWTRFMAPILPIMLVIAVLFLLHITDHYLNLVHKILNIKYQISKLNILYFIFYFLFLLPGLAYLAIYQNPDVRFEASEWIYKNIPANSYILSETANAVDIPISSQIKNKILNVKNLRMVSFNFYDLDQDMRLQKEIGEHLNKADYLFIPSRRIFANHTCSENIKYQISNIKMTNQKPNIFNTNKCEYLKAKYPLLNDYYEKLFSGKLGFRQVAEFNSYPRISLFGKTLLEFPDEGAEETWTVFDHPVIRIYKRN